MPIYRGLHPARVFRGDSMPRAVYRGAAEIWRRDAAWVRATTTVGSQITIPVPTWAAYVDILVLGAGGGGGTGDGALWRSGNGGGAGSWDSSVAPVAHLDSLSVTVGRGGYGGNGGNGGAGGSTTVSAGSITVSGNGGYGGSGWGGASGAGVGVSPVDPSPVTGGGPAGTNAVGSYPGGGGGPGSGGTFGWYLPGRDGANGDAWLRFRSY